MTNKEKLYETLGELLYAVAKADGVIQETEVDAMKELLKDHSWAENVNWSFCYEQTKGHSAEDIYKKAVSFCQAHGPAPEYEEFIEAMKLIAKADSKLEASESAVIEKFSSDLISQFKRDIEMTS